MIMVTKFRGRLAAGAAMLLGCLEAHEAYITCLQQAAVYSRLKLANERAVFLTAGRHEK